MRGPGWERRPPDDDTQPARAATATVDEVTSRSADSVNRSMTTCFMYALAEDKDDGWLLHRAEQHRKKLGVILG